VQIIPPDSISSLFTKWGDGLAQKRKCEVKDGNKIEISYNFDQDGCIRIPNDLQALTGYFGLLQNIVQIFFTYKSHSVPSWKLFWKSNEFEKLFTTCKKNKSR
jgi:hypothetical protein